MNYDDSEEDAEEDSNEESENVRGSDSPCERSRGAGNNRLAEKTKGFGLQRHHQRDDKEAPDSSTGWAPGCGEHRLLTTGVP